MNKLIETALPLSEINARTIRERTVAGHPANMHMWWGRSPQASSVLSLTAAMVDAPENPDELQERLRIRTHCSSRIPAAEGLQKMSCTMESGWESRRSGNWKRSILANQKVR